MKLGYFIIQHDQFLDLCLRMNKATINKYFYISFTHES